MLPTAPTWFAACLLVLGQGGATSPPEAVARALETLSIASLEELDQALGREPDAGLAAALATLAQHLDAQGQRERAVAPRLDALRMRLELFGESDPRSLALVQALLESYLLQGRYLEGAQLARERVLGLEPGADEDPGALANLLNMSAVALQGLGEFSEAEECTRRALDYMLGSAGPSHPRTLRLMSNLANLLGDQGRLREARELALEAHALRLEHEGPESEAVARSHMVLARLLELGGEFGPAEEHLRRAESLLRARDPVQPIYLSEALRMLGVLALTRGDAAGAEASYREARALIVAGQGAAHPDVQECDVGIGFALFQSGRAAEALPIFEAAAAAREALFGAADDLTLQARISLALAREQTGDVAGAVELLRAQLALIAADAGARPELGTSVRSNLARCLMSLGELGEAESLLAATVEGIVSRHGAESVFLIEPKARQALLAEARGDPQRAEALAREAMQIASAERDRVLGADVERSLNDSQMGHGEMSRLVARLCLQRGDLPAALAALEESRARTLLDGLLRAGRAAAGEGGEGVDEPLEKLLTREEQARAVLRGMEAQSALAPPSAAAEAEVLAQRLAVARNALNAATAALGLHARETTQSARPADVARIAAGLGTDEALFSFLWSADEVGWIELRAGESGPELRAHTCAEGQQAVAALGADTLALAAALTRDPRSRGELPPIPSALAGLGASEALAGLRRVYVVPDGPLASVPFGLLLGERVREVVLLPSASTLAVLTERGAAQDPPTRAVVLGDPSFGAGPSALSRSGRALSPLPATRAEAVYVAALLEAAGRDVHLLTGEGATRGALEQACEQVGLLHLATHGFSGSSRAPFDASLALAAGPDGESTLTLDRLIRRWEGRLSGCELVVLSACETHREVDLGSGAFSLAIGFFHAGAGAVLASLWQVDEQATALLMGRFTENLLGLRGELGADGALKTSEVERLPAAAALGEAQTWLRSASRDEVRSATRRMGLGARTGAKRSDDAGARPEPTTAELQPYADPYFWSGFVLLGR